MSIIFIGTPEFAVPSLRRLVESGHEIAAVITQPDRPAGRGRQTRASPVKIAATELGLTVLQPAGLRDEAVLKQIEALRPELMVAVAYGQILRQGFLDIAPRGVLNVHPSLLPKYRGAAPIPAAILAGDEVTGVTIMLMDAGMDSGPILAQRQHPIEADDTTGTLSSALSEAGAGLLAETVPGWLAGEVEAHPQDDARATVSKLLKKEDGRIAWRLTAVDIWRRVRAYNPWPGAHTKLDGALLHIWQGRAIQVNSGVEPGTVVEIGPGDVGGVPTSRAGVAFAVGTGEGLLIPLEVQREGRKRVSAAEFLRGAPGLIGRRLE